MALFHFKQKKKIVVSPAADIISADIFCSLEQHKTNSLILACEAGYSSVAEFFIEPFKAAGLLDEPNIVSNCNFLFGHFELSHLYPLP